VGLPLPADAGEILARYNMPDRMFPEFSWPAALIATLVMFAGTQVATWISVLRIRHLQPVKALRALE
jgi:ABC-type antimicrobial peptide transport system permease subunit